MGSRWDPDPAERLKAAAARILGAERCWLHTQNTHKTILKLMPCLLCSSLVCYINSLGGNQLLLV